MPYLKSLMIAVLVAVGAAQAGGTATPAPLKLGQTNYTYSCSNKQSVQVTYVTTGGQHDANPVFMVLKYKGKSYGLSEAVSGSGSRYVGHAGLNTGSGLEWWEHQGEATLSIFKGDNSTNSTPLLTCRPSGR